MWRTLEWNSRQKATEAFFVNVYEWMYESVSSSSFRSPPSCQWRRVDLRMRRNLEDSSGGTSVFQQQLSTPDLTSLFRLLILVLFLTWGSFFNGQHRTLYLLGQFLSGISLNSFQSFSKALIWLEYSGRCSWWKQQTPGVDTARLQL